MEILAQHIQPYFSITKEEFTGIEHLFKTEKILKGDFFIKREQYCEKMSFIQQGYIRVFADSKNKEITQWIASEGYFITDLYSFIFDQRARWNIQALTDCSLFTISKENYKKLSEILPNWHNLEKKFIASCFATLEDRVFDHLSLNTEERYLKFFHQNKGLFNEIPLQFLASMLGMTPETLSRIRKKFNS